MITLGFAQLVYFLVVQMPLDRRRGRPAGDPARQGALGLVPLDRPITMYYFVFAAFLVGFFVIHRTIHSPFGHVLRAIRENEPRALSLGYDVDRYKLLAFVLSAGARRARRVR